MENIKKHSYKSFETYALEWDTNYFGVSSAKVILKGNVSEDELKDLKKNIDGFTFITIINKGNNPYNNTWLGKDTTAFLTDMNIQFVKTIKEVTLNQNETTEVCEAFPSEECVLEIARNAFTYSRFFNDLSLNEEKAKNIYAHWTESAFNKPGKYFVISKQHEIIAGFLLFSISKEEFSATIELIAVDEAYRGCKVGKSLILAMEAFTCARGIEKIKVGTQIENIVASRFYTECEFKYTGCNAVYHYWPKNN